MRKQSSLIARGRSLLTAMAILAVVNTSDRAQAQTFNSGSTGVDGPLDLTAVASGTTVEFDPAVLGIDLDRDNVFHFTTITIPAGVTLHLSAKYTHGPVYWLVSGAVDIKGIVDLSGADGNGRALSVAMRVPAIPGPGGYPGGLAGGNWTGSPWIARQGLGAGGGAAGVTTNVGRGTGGTYSGNEFLVPLLGGSGGGGGSDGNYSWFGGGGGAGGGALLIASSVSISITKPGEIRATGGNGGAGAGDCFNYTFYYCYYYGGSGSGGAIRLVAPVLNGNGTLTVAGGGQLGRDLPNGSAGPGRIRLEAFQQNGTPFTLTGNWSTGTPLSSYIPTAPPSVLVTGVGGMSVPPKPAGAFDPPDVTMNSGNPVEVLIQARSIPVGTVVKLYLFSLDGSDQVIDTPPLTGTIENSSTTAMVTFPAGFTRGYAHAKW